MALQDINLVPENEIAGQAKAGPKILYVVSGVILAGFLVVLVVLFALFSLSIKNLNDIRSQKKPIENNIQALAKREYYVRAIAGKMSAIQNIQGAQAPFEKIMGRLIDLEGSDVAYTEIGLSAPNSVLISATATNLDAVDRFLADLTQKEFGRQIFSGVVLQSMSRQTNGTYELTLHFLYMGENK